jgi:hypothetical protein
LEVLLELRELFKKGVPISSAIEAKHTAWTKQLDKVPYNVVAKPPVI